MKLKQWESFKSLDNIKTPVLTRSDDLADALRDAQNPDVFSDRFSESRRLLPDSIIDETIEVAAKAVILEKVRLGAVVLAGTAEQAISTINRQSPSQRIQDVAEHIRNLGAAMDEVTQFELRQRSLPEERRQNTAPILAMAEKAIRDCYETLGLPVPEEKFELILIK